MSVTYQYLHSQYSISRLKIRLAYRILLLICAFFLFHEGALVLDWHFSCKMTQNIIYIDHHHTIHHLNQIDSFKWNVLPGTEIRDMKGMLNVWSGYRSIHFIPIPYYSFFFGNCLVFWEFRGNIIDHDRRATVFTALSLFATMGVICLCFLRKSP